MDLFLDRRGKIIMSKLIKETVNLIKDRYPFLRNIDSDTDVLELAKQFIQVNQQLSQITIKWTTLYLILQFIILSNEFPYQQEDCLNEGDILGVHDIDFNFCSYYSAFTQSKKVSR